MCTRVTSAQIEESGRTYSEDTEKGRCRDPKPRDGRDWITIGFTISTPLTQRIHQLVKKHQNGDMQSVEWLDRLALRRAELTITVSIDPFML